MLMGQFRGKDGGWYNTWEEMRGADGRYEQQERQNELLAKQNNLLEQQKRLEFEKITQNAAIEIQKMEIQREQMRHNEQMRILGLFDEIGISTSSYLNFKNDLFAIDMDLNPLDNFIEFRRNHYNSKIEKLLLDVGLKDEVLQFGLDYPKINNSNKISDGTIEDCITYFDKLDTE